MHPPPGTGLVPEAERQRFFGAHIASIYNSVKILNIAPYPQTVNNNWITPIRPSVCVYISN